MEVTVTTPRDLDGLQLTATITGRDVQELGVRAYAEAIEKLGKELATQIMTRAVTRAL